LSTILIGVEDLISVTFYVPVNKVAAMLEGITEKKLEEAYTFLAGERSGSIYC